MAPWAPAQLGLDGRAYAPSSPQATETPGGSSPLLGPSHAVCHQTLGPPSQTRLELPPEPSQLDLWDRLDVVHGLLYGTEHDRQAKCLRTRRVRGEDVTVARSARGGFSTTGLVLCGHWTCPYCGPRRAYQVAGELGALIRKHLDDQAHDAAMLSLTIPHELSDGAASTVDRLYGGWRNLTRSRAWREFVDDYGVDAVRVLDATHGGENGCHPHFHVLLLMDRPPTTRITPDDARMAAEAARVRVRDVMRYRQRERDARLAALAGELRDAWRAATAAGGVVWTTVADDLDPSVKITGAEDAERYFTRWGLQDEVARSTNKERNHLWLIDRCAAGDDAAGQSYIEFRCAVDGRHWISGLADALERAGVSDADVECYLVERRAELDKQRPPEQHTPFAVRIAPHLYNRVLVVGWSAVVRVAGAAADESADAQAAVERYLWSVVPRIGRESRARAGPS